MKNKIETAIEEWIKQGRSEEQVYGVRNFMSGVGLKLFKEKKSGAEIFTEGMFEGIKRERKAWLDGNRCHTCGRYKKPSQTSDMCGKCWEEA